MHWNSSLRQYVHHAKPLFDVITSEATLHWVARNIEGARDWELRLRAAAVAESSPESSADSAGASLSHSDSFIQLCKNGALALVQTVVERTHVGLEARGEDNMAALHWAASNGHLPVVQYLCDQGADKEAKANKDKTALHLAAFHDHLAVVQYLCEHGADKEAESEYGWTAMHLAAKQGYAAVVQALCEQDANMEARSSSGRTPLHMAADLGHLPVVQYLVTKGADKEARSNSDQTPMVVASMMRHKQVYIFLKSAFDPAAGTGTGTVNAGGITCPGVSTCLFGMRVLFNVCFRRATRSRRCYAM